MTNPIELAKAATPSWMMDIQKYDGLEISPVREFKDAASNQTHCERCQPEEADFWSIFGHLTEGGAEYFEDFGCEEDARAFAAKLLKVYPHLNEFGLTGCS